MTTRTLTTVAKLQVWLRGGFAVLLVSAGCIGHAEAGLDSCAVMVNQFSPSDIGLAYQFVKDHGECIARLEDPAFQVVAGTLTSLATTGVLQPGQCTSILGKPSSQAAQKLLAVADAGVVGQYLDCGCAVADSGIAQKIKGLVESAVACAKSMDPSAAIASGMKKAGDVLGLSTLWGMAGSDHDPRAGVGNGGQQQEAYDVAMCPATGVPFVGWTHGWDGTPLQPGQRVRNCNCPSPTRPYADGKFVDIGQGLFHGPTFTCLTCPPNTAKDKYGNCSACMNKTGLAGFETWEPNRDGSTCVMTHVEPINPCKPDENWNHRNGLGAVCCASWQSVSKDWNSCESRCPIGRIWDGQDCTACEPDTEKVENSCQACPSGAHTSNSSPVCVADACPDGQGLLPGGSECMVCPPDTQRKQGGHCEPCTQGAHSKGGDDFCAIMGFPGVSCPAGTVHPPNDAVACVCAPGTEEVGGLCQPVETGLHAIGGAGALRNMAPATTCPPERTNADGSCAAGCSGATVANPQRPGSCMACPDDTAPNADHSACEPAARLRPILQRIGG